MRKKALAAVTAAFAMAAAFALTGCGAALDREVVLHDMTMNVPGNWLESPEENGTVRFIDEDDDLDEGEAANSIVVTYRNLGSEAASAPADIAAKDMAAKQKALEQEYGIDTWSIDKEKAQVIDGAQVTTYEYSFVKDIAGEKRTYEFACAYVVTTEAVYEIGVIGNAVGIYGIVDSIEF